VHEIALFNSQLTAWM